MAGLRSLRLLDWSGLTGADDELTTLSQLDSLKTLRIPRSDVTASGLAKLRGLTQLESLELAEGSNVSDDTILAMPSFPHLTHLDLHGTQISDAGLAVFAKLSELRHLETHGCVRITGEGMQHLVLLKKLRFLNMDYTSLMPAALPHLKQMRNLRILKVRGTKINATEAAELQAALPECVVFHESLDDTPWRFPQPELPSVDPKPEVASPLDQLRREDIDPHALAIAGRGDPAVAPRELVAVIGDGRLRHGRWVVSTAYSPNGKWVASLRRVETGENDEVVVWDVETGHVVRRIDSYGLQEGHPRQIAFNPDGERIASAGPGNYESPGNGLQVVNVETGKEIHWLAEESVITSVAYSADGRFLAASDQQGRVHLWDPQTGENLHILEAADEAISCIDLTADGSRLAVGSGHTVSVWDTESQERVFEFTDHAEPVVSVAISPDGTRLATGTGGVDRAPWTANGRLWDLTSGNQLAELGSDEVVFSPDGEQLAVRIMHGVQLYHAASGRFIQEVAGAEEFQNWGVGPHVKGMAYSPRLETTCHAA